MKDYLVVIDAQTKEVALTRIEYLYRSMDISMDELLADLVLPKISIEVVNEIYEELMERF